MLHKLSLIIVMTCMTAYARAVDIKARLGLKTPGNPSVSYSLTSDGSKLLAGEALPVEIMQKKVQQSELHGINRFRHGPLRLLSAGLLVS